MEEPEKVVNSTSESTRLINDCTHRNNSSLFALTHLTDEKNFNKAKLSKKDLEGAVIRRTEEKYSVTSKYLYISGLMAMVCLTSFYLYKHTCISNKVSEYGSTHNDFLRRKVLSVDDSIHYVDTPVSSRWKNLRQELKEKILDSNLNFKGEIVKFKDLNEKYPEAFNALTFEQINDVLKGKEIIVGEKVVSNADFYVERHFVHEEAKMIYFEYEFGHEFVETYLDPKEHMEKTTKNKSFTEFYEEFSKLSSDDRFRIVEKVRENEYFKTLYFDFNDESFHFLIKSSNDIIEQAQKERILVLSSEMGAGKTTTFEQLAMEIKKQFPTKWVSYINLKSFPKFHKTEVNLDNVEEILAKMLGLDSNEDGFEIAIFKKFFKLGNVVLFLDDFGETSSFYNELALNLIKFIHEHTSNIQFVSTRELYLGQLSKVFKTRTLELLPFNENQKLEFLRKFFVSQNVPSEKVDQKIEITEEIFKKFDFDDDHITPVMIKLIAEVHENETLFKPENIYNIFETIVHSTIERWLDKNKVEPRLQSHNAIKIYLQKYALLSELPLLGFKILTLQIVQTKIPKHLINEISQMRILFFNNENDFNFLHKTFSHFFIAQYLIENVFNIDGSVDSDEAELRLEIFACLTHFYGISQQATTNFMNSFLHTRNKNEDKHFHPTISKLLRTKFKNLFIRMLVTNNPVVFEFAFEFFQKDHDLLVDLLHVHKDETFYTAIFNPSHFGLFTNPENIKSLAKNYLNEEEFETFINGNNQKGVILLGIHFYGLLNITKSNDVYDTEVKLLNGISYWEFLNKIKESLTRNEQKELFMAASSPKIYLFYDKLFSLSDFPEYENLWSSFENSLTKSEMHAALATTLINYLEVKPNGKTGHENFFSLWLGKADKFLSNSDTFEMFLTKNILHEALWGDFETLWSFVSNRTNEEQRRRILLQDDLDDKNFYLNHALIEAKEKFSNHQYCYFPYDFTPFKIFHRSLTRPSAPTYDFTVEIYENYFNKTEIQELILSSNYFFSYVISKAKNEPCEKFVSYLGKLFKGDEKTLKEYLERKIKPTKRSVLELFEDLTRLPFSLPMWSDNLKTFTDLYDKL